MGKEICTIRNDREAKENKRKVGFLGGDAAKNRSAGAGAGGGRGAWGWGGGGRREREAGGGGGGGRGGGLVGWRVARVRDLFKQAREHAPAIIFIDELDSIGRARGMVALGGSSEQEQTLNQILAEMDGFTGREGIIVLAATNQPDVLDKALLRPGRFDRRVVVNLPDRNGREAILKVHTRHVPLASDVSLGEIASATPGLAGADLRNLVNEAALLAARREKESVSQKDFMDS